MTDAEKKRKSYIHAVERRLNLPPAVRERVMSDFSSSIAARLEAGQSDAQIYAELGSPRKAAAELNEQMREFAYRKSPWRFAFLALAILSAIWILGKRVFPLLFLRSSTVGIIGGADGPTSIFLTSRLSSDWLLAVCLLVLGIVGFLRLHKCRRK